MPELNSNNFKGAFTKEYMDLKDQLKNLFPEHKETAEPENN